MLSRFIAIILLFQIRRIALAIDPLGALPVKDDCFDARNITGCSETFAEAFEKVGKAEAEGITCNINIFLFTRRNANNPEFLHNCGKLPNNTNYKASSRTIIFVHGYLGSLCGHAAIREIKDQLLYRENYNVVLLEWAFCALDFLVAMNQVRVIGKQIAFLIESIMEQTNTTGEMFHIVGHSFGAQIAGVATNYLKTGQIRRITGLDPGMPGFQDKDVDGRLDKSDAKVVDIIHTDGGLCFPHLGDYRRIGHADFYPNGGSVQISCVLHTLEMILKGDIPMALSNLCMDTCYHTQVLEYFKVSINDCSCMFIGVKCDSYEAFKNGKCRSCGDDGSNCAVMGMDYEEYPRPQTGNHTYFLETSLLCPYCNNSGIDIQGFSESLKKGKQRCWPETPAKNFMKL